jgi:hypothetical protein
MRGPSAIFPSAQGSQVDLQQPQGLLFKIIRNNNFPDLFSNGKIRVPGPKHMD